MNQFDCDMCSNPYPYRCNECAGVCEESKFSDSSNENEVDRPKLWVGSGEDIKDFVYA